METVRRRSEVARSVAGGKPVSVERRQSDRNDRRGGPGTQFRSPA
jgi:hypothetical protein